MTVITFNCVFLSEVCDALPAESQEAFNDFVSDLVSWGDAEFTLVDPAKVAAAIEKASSDFVSPAAVIARLNELSAANRYIALEG